MSEPSAPCLQCPGDHTNGEAWCAGIVLTPTSSVSALSAPGWEGVDTLGRGHGAGWGALKLRVVTATLQLFNHAAFLCRPASELDAQLL